MSNIIPIYAAILSTIVAAWNIYKEIKARSGRLKFHYDEEYFNDPEREIYGNFAFISIVNSGEKTRVVRDWK